MIKSKRDAFLYVSVLESIMSEYKTNLIQSKNLISKQHKKSKTRVLLFYLYVTIKFKLVQLLSI